jgi:hypothetical protein
MAVRLGFSGTGETGRMHRRPSEGVRTVGIKSEMSLSETEP